MTSDAHGKVVLGWWDGYPLVPLYRALLPPEVDNSGSIILEQQGS